MRGVELGRGVGDGVTGPGRTGPRERMGWVEVFLLLGFLSISYSFLFLIQTNLNQMNPNLNLDSLKHSNKLNNAPA